MWVLRMMWYFQSPEASKAFHSGKNGQLNWLKSKETDQGAKTDLSKRIYFVDHLYVETFLLLARGAAGSTVRSDVRGTTGS